jgi:hypothetical protein
MVTFFVNYVEMEKVGTNCAAVAEVNDQGLVSLKFFISVPPNGNAPVTHEMLREKTNNGAVEIPL